jgi:lipopolysaccharide/colanic/teichoic acid biosynthesis glycosyltransferase
MISTLLEERSFLTRLGRVSLSTEPLNHRISDAAGLPSFLSDGDFREENRVESRARHELRAAESAEIDKENQVILPFGDRSRPVDLESVWKGLSPWSRSAAKRIFDCSCVLLSAPFVLPIVLATALAVRLTSRGPVFFLQERMGYNGRAFTIFKFRTMVHVVDAPHNPIATPDRSCFTPVGLFLRRWKLDELPQLLNVLLGHMSLVGPRPKMPEHVRYDLPCRPGITGMATIVFACEEEILASVAKDQLEEYFHAVVLPAKRQLDAEYMAQATFLSDLRLLVRSVFRRWDSASLREIVVAAAFQMDEGVASPQGYRHARSARIGPAPVRATQPVDADEVSAL